MFDFQFTIIATTLYVAPENQAHPSALSEILRNALLANGCSDVQITSETDGGQTLTTADLKLTLHWKACTEESCLAITLGHAQAPAKPDPARLERLLLELVHPLMGALCVQSVDWLQTGLRIPAQDFIEAAFADDLPDKTRVTPRRVRCGTLRTDRPDRNTARPCEWPDPANRPGAIIPRRIRPAPGAMPRRRALRQPPRARQDAHVRSFESHLADTIRQPPSKAELEALRMQLGTPSTPERLATWAISLSAATVSLPVALPVLAANVTRGESLRAASLVMGLVGVFSLSSDPATAMTLVSLF
jgi:hypothetical protein